MGRSKSSRQLRQRYGNHESRKVCPTPGASSQPNAFSTPPTFAAVIPSASTVLPRIRCTSLSVRAPACGWPCGLRWRGCARRPGQHLRSRPPLASRMEQTSAEGERGGVEVRTRCRSDGWRRCGGRGGARSGVRPWDRTTRLRRGRSLCRGRRSMAWSGRRAGASSARRWSRLRIVAVVLGRQLSRRP